MLKVDANAIPGPRESDEGSGLRPACREMSSSRSDQKSCSDATCARKWGSSRAFEERFFILFGPKDKGL